MQITGENVIKALLSASGMTWKQLCQHMRVEGSANDEMGLINCLYGLTDVGLISIDGLPRNAIDPDAILTFVHRSDMVMRASDTWRRTHQALTNCWDNNRGRWPSRGKYTCTCEPIFEMPRGRLPKWDIFMAMPFDDRVAPVYDDHICPVIKKLSLTIGRADHLFSEQPIIDEIWAMISRSRMVVAECTGRNPNVFYEIGIAHTVGKPVVVITQSGNDVPFDLRHRRFIEYQMTPRGMTVFEGVLGSTITQVLSAQGNNDDSEFEYL